MNGQIIFDLFVIIAVFEMFFLAVELDFGDYKSTFIFVKGFFKNRNVFGCFLSLIVIILLSPGLLSLTAIDILITLIGGCLSALWKAGDKK